MSDLLAVAVRGSVRSPGSSPFSSPAMAPVALSADLDDVGVKAPSAPVHLVLDGGRAVPTTALTRDTQSYAIKLNLDSGVFSGLPEPKPEGDAIVPPKKKPAPPEAVKLFLSVLFLGAGIGELVLKRYMFSTSAFHFPIFTALVTQVPCRTFPSAR